MNFIATRETQLGYIPVAQILQETPFDFRRAGDSAIDDIRNSLVRHGQAHAVTLEAFSDGKYRLLDGHRRFSAVRKIRSEGGTWHKLLAHVVPPDLTPLDRFKIIRDRNDAGERSFGITERGRFFFEIRKQGLCVSVIAREYGITIAEVEDHLELAEAPQGLAERLDRTRINAMFAAMLARRYQGWQAGPHADQANDVLMTLLAHASNETLTIKSWRFLLDFYWSGNRPFMADIEENN